MNLSWVNLQYTNTLCLSFRGHFYASYQGSKEPKGVCGLHHLQVCSFVICTSCHILYWYYFWNLDLLLWSGLQLCFSRLGRVRVQHGGYKGRLQRALRSQGRARPPLGRVRWEDTISASWNGGLVNTRRTIEIIKKDLGKKIKRV